MARKEVAKKVTTLEELRKVGEGDVVELPPFSENVPFVVRMKRPSMLELVKTGRIPNQLLDEANKLFSKGPGGVLMKPNASGQAMNELFELLDIICEASFIEPRFSDLKEAGVSLTDDQYMFVFSYMQKGVKALESFRENGGGA